MTKYYIRTVRGEEGPFTREELRLKPISPETLACSDGISWMPAGDMDDLKSLFPAVSKLNIKKRVAKSAPASDGSTSETKSRSKLSLLQGATIVLLIANGLVYYYKSGDPVKTEPVTTSVPSEEPEVITVKRTIPSPKPAVIENPDTLIRIRNHWQDYITARHNDFKFYTKLGGIRRLEAIIQNQTEFPLDSVKVAVKYMRRGEIFKTEYVTFNNIPEQGEISLPAPNSKSGNSVILEIIEIASQKMRFYYNSTIAAEGTEDPFFRSSSGE